LRPNGNSGLLVSTFEAYANYQNQRGDNTAWTWEHQAMTRARFCLGAATLKARFDDVRASVINAKRSPLALRQEIVAMRDKLHSAHPVKPDLFDVKHSLGGMVDVEFVVQYLVLAHAQSHPALLANVGNIALLQTAESVGLLPAGVGVAAGRAYRELRRVQHRARLDEQPTQVPQSELTTECQAIQALWAAVFKSSD
jgi:glutamate-ammonia-ligase adenylyltransferase